MQSLALYLLKVIICSGILLLYYKLALRNKRFHYYNRFYLLATIAASLLLPLLKVDWLTIHSNNTQAIALLDATYVQQVTVTAKPGFAINWQQLITVSYALVSLLFGGILIWRVYKIYAFKKKYTSTSMGEFDFINTDLTQAPFSFLQNLFWRSDIDLSETTGRQILQHELTHIRQKHTWDKLWMQVILAVLWINPFYWFIQKELFMLHEFIADEKAIENNDGAAFAAMLLTSQYGKSIFAPGQSFAYSPIKRRLFMLTNLTTPRYSYLRRIMVLPLLAIVVLLSAFRLQKINDDNKTPNAEEQYTETHLTVDSAGMVAIDTTPANGVVERPIARDASDTTKPTFRFTDKGLTYSLNSAVPFSNVLMFVNDKEVSANDLQTIDPSDISSVHVLKDVSAVKKFGQRAANGVVEIYTKQYAADNHIVVDNVIIDGSAPNRTNLVNLTYIKPSNDTVRIEADTITVTNLQLQPTKHDTVIEVEGHPLKRGDTPRVPFAKPKKGDIEEVTVRGYPTKKRADSTKVAFVKPKDNSLEEVEVVGFAKPRKQSDTAITVTGYRKNVVHVTDVQLEALQVSEQAKFPGGAPAWQEFLSRNLKADVVVKKGGPAGKYTVIVSFVVDEDGNVSEVKALNDPGYGTAAEAVRVIQHGPDWVPAKLNGKAIKYRQKQAITFAVSE